MRWRRQANVLGQVHSKEFCLSVLIYPHSVKQTANNLTKTFSDFEGTISENDEEQLLLAQWFDLAPVWCGTDGMGGVCACVCMCVYVC